MTKKNLDDAIALCNEGKLKINNGNYRSFLLYNKWYPLRLIINCAKQIAGEKANNTTDRNLVELGYLLPYLRLEKKLFNSRFPVEITESERLAEISHLSTILKNLGKNS